MSDTATLPSVGERQKEALQGLIALSAKCGKARDKADNERRAAEKATNEWAEYLGDRLKLRHQASQKAQSKVVLALEKGEIAGQKQEATETYLAHKKYLEELKKNGRKELAKARKKYEEGVEMAESLFESFVESASTKIAQT